MTAAVKKSKITKKELFRAYNKWYWLCEVSHCYDRLQSLSFCASIQNTLRKLYPNDEEYQEALLRHLQFFNTEGTIGSVIHGITMSLEEEKAANKEISGEMIIALKTGLMGPVAGIGDTLIWGTLKPMSCTCYNDGSKQQSNWCILRIVISFGWIFHWLLYVPSGIFTWP